jgi:hypothetical protein
MSVVGRHERLQSLLEPGRRRRLHIKVIGERRSVAEIVKRPAFQPLFPSPALLRSR